MGHQVFSMGSYQNPNSPIDLKRPGYKGFYSSHLNDVALQCSKENIHQELIDWADIVFVMHRIDWIFQNWEKLKGKKVIWRSIGQSVPSMEQEILGLKNNGIKIVRYSPAEEGLGNYAGQDALIRFYKDPDEFTGYNGSIPNVLNISQSAKQRNGFCGYEYLLRVAEESNLDLFGEQSKFPDGSPMTDPIFRGLLSFDDLKKAYQNYRVYFYTGTYPASYTLNFIEAFMTGIPVVAIGEQLANIGVFEHCDTYEVHKIIRDGENGYVSNNINELKDRLRFLIDNPDKAKEIGEKGRQTAIELFGKKTIKRQWKEFFESLL